MLATATVGSDNGSNHLLKTKNVNFRTESASNVYYNFSTKQTDIIVGAWLLMMHISLHLAKMSSDGLTHTGCDRLRFNNNHFTGPF